MVTGCGRGDSVKIGVGVEGPSDRTFWHEVLHKHFGGIQFDVRTMGSKETLIRQTPRLLETFRSLKYTAGFILVDQHRDPCFGSVLQQFDEAIRGEARIPVNDRYLFVCVAIRGLESWFLADPFSINGLMPGANYIAPRETARVNPKRKLSDLWTKQFGPNSSPRKIGLARMMAPQFDPEVARQHSASFDHFWTRLTTNLAS